MRYRVGQTRQLLNRGTFESGATVPGSHLDEVVVWPFPALLLARPGLPESASSPPERHASSTSLPRHGPVWHAHAPHSTVRLRHLHDPNVLHLVDGLRRRLALALQEEEKVPIHDLHTQGSRVTTDMRDRRVESAPRSQTDLQ
jgi:hypothetical protein